MITGDCNKVQSQVPLPSEVTICTQVWYVHKSVGNLLKKKQAIANTTRVCAHPMGDSVVMDCD